MSDGGLARRLNAVSAFGKEFDSLADLAVFGIALSSLLYQQSFGNLGIAGLVLSFLPTLCAAVRLARFNIQPTSRHFRGMPTPATAGLIAGFLLLQTNHLLVLLALTCIACVLMLCPLPFPRTIQWRSLAVAILAITLCLLLMAGIANAAFFVITVGYITWAIIDYGLCRLITYQRIRKPSASIKPTAPIASPRLSHDPQHGH
jgi:CDP-diacylglycerol--serine O-phosphatidyltransferase